MDLNASQAIRLLVPKIPFIIKIVTWHVLGLSKTSTKWDLRMELAVLFIRSLLINDHPRSISAQQKGSTGDSAVKGPMWISRVKAEAPPEDDMRQAVFGAIDSMKAGGETYTKPEYKSIEAEWTGYRSNVSKDAPEPSLSEPEKFKKLMSDTKSNVTILFFHGGAYYLLDPASHRVPVSKLAKRTGGRALSVRYRLAPQNPFPAALLDALLMYLYLLHPPAGALHEPVPASNIVFAGDSAGGNLSFALLQLILQLHRSAPAGQTPTIKFHGNDVPIPIPAGVSSHSPWFDITRSMPSLEANAAYDYLPPPSATPANFPPCAIWPAAPPRAEIYCDGSAATHPLVSPLAAGDWAGAPPAFIGCGEELLADEDAAVAARLARQGVTVAWEQFEAMPHCFAMIFEAHGAGPLFLDKWAAFVKAAVDDPARLKTKGTWTMAKKLQRKEVDVVALAKMEDDEVFRLMNEAKEKLIKRFEAKAKPTPKL